MYSPTYVGKFQGFKNVLFLRQKILGNYNFHFNFLSNSNKINLPNDELELYCTENCIEIVTVFYH